MHLWLGYALSHNVLEAGKVPARPMLALLLVFPWWPLLQAGDWTK